MSDTELRRPSTWAISLGMAAAYTAAAIMGTQESGGALMPSGYYVVMFVRVAGTFLALIHGTHLVILALALLPSVREWWYRLRPPPTKTISPQPPVVYQREVGGVVGNKPRTLLMDELRPARWSAWNDTALEVVGWYRVTGSLIYGVTAGRGKAFKDNDDAKLCYEEMARHGLVEHHNGRATVLSDSLPSVMAAIRSGKIDWTDAYDPPPILPAPLRHRAPAPVTIQSQS